MKNYAALFLISYAMLLLVAAAQSQCLPLACFANATGIIGGWLLNTKAAR